MASAVHEALDRLLALAEQQGFRRNQYLGVGPDPSIIRARLAELGFEPTQEIVDFFSWRDVIHPRGSAPLFWETEYWPLEAMLAAYRANSSLVPPAERSALLWPGPASWFPVLMTDPGEMVVVELGDNLTGSVWFTFTQDTPFMMYPSLLRAVEGAERAMASGAWWFDVKEGIMRAKRNWMPWPGDVDPWAEPKAREAKPDTLPDG